MQDQQIVALFLERSENAVRELSNKYGTLCKTLSYHIVRNEQDAEECVNDAYLAVWNTIPPETPNPLKAYICRIVRNLSLKKYHANTARKRDSFDVGPDDDPGTCSAWGYFQTSGTLVEGDWKVTFPIENRE